MAHVERSDPKTSDPKRAVEVYFDGACPLCRREIGAYKRMVGEGDVTWNEVAAGGDAPAPDLPREAALARFHSRRADGTLVSGFRAFIALWRDMERLRFVARLLDRQPFHWIGECGYRALLVVRKTWRRAT